MELKLVLLFCIFNCVLFTKAQNDIKYLCNMSVSYMSDIRTRENIQNVKKYCQDFNKPCVPKCCGLDEVLVPEDKKIPNSNKTKKWPKCTSLKALGLISVDYTELEIYKISTENVLLKTERNFPNDFHVIQNRIFENSTCVERWEGSTPFLLEDGMFTSDSLFIGTWRKKEHNYFCVDLTYNKKRNSTKVKFFVALETGFEDEGELEFVGVSLVISSIFLVPVLLVYGVLPQLRNLSGMLLMAYVATLLLAFVSKAILIFFTSYMIGFCLVFTPFFYFVCLSYFFWLNIMSFDIWWTFRGQRLKRNINRRGELVKFGWYSLYGWGAPLAMTIMAVIIDSKRDQLPISIHKPGFETCSVADLLYLDLPIGLLTMINVALFIMTVYNIWLIKRRLGKFSESSSSTTKNQNRFGMYVKMSMLMGVSWLLELSGYIYPNLPLWANILIDFYNALIGVVIFVMFVLNKKTLRMLCKRYNINCRFLDSKKFDPNTSRSNNKSSTNRGSYNTPNTDYSDVEMYDIEVSANPNPK